jgi:GST-like protein
LGLPRPCRNIIYAAPSQESPAWPICPLSDHAALAAAHPERLQLYSLNTPNGVKVSIMLEETGLPYEPHLVDIVQGREQDARIPLAEPERQDPGDHRSGWPDGRPIGLFESGAILLYLADKTGNWSPPTRPGAGRRSAWLFFQMGGSDRCSARLASSTSSPAVRSPTKRRSNAMSLNRSGCSGARAQLGDRTWIMGDDYSIADISLLGWVRNLIGVLRGARAGRFRQLRERRRLAGARPGEAGGAKRTADTVARLILANSVVMIVLNAGDLPASGCDRPPR